MSEDLTSYLQERNFRVKILHSEIETIERSKNPEGLEKRISMLSRD